MYWNWSFEYEEGIAGNCYSRYLEKSGSTYWKWGTKIEQEKISAWPSENSASDSSDLEDDLDNVSVASVYWIVFSWTIFM